MWMKLGVSHFSKLCNLNGPKIDFRGSFRLFTSSDYDVYKVH